ncbi:MAG: hypothetical protein IMZ50_07235, partial [Candidatus Atribacteria bacterium]|nr:hypothetical protein [Candidatus Atribacteria bacterium]
FQKWKVRGVVFVEAAELEIIGAAHADPSIDLVEQQIREFHREGFEVGLHLHPQWYNAGYEDGHWQLDYGEYNLCHLSSDRIDQFIERSIAYLRKVLGASDYNPLSFRAGNWLLQPTRAAAKSLAGHGIKIDSSVFKGGRQHQYDLDYRRSRKNGYHWPFSADVNVPDPQGILLEIPTFTEMVPTWKMFTAKRIGLQQKDQANTQHRQKRLARLRDFARFRHPMKLDFCRLTAAEMIRMFDQEAEKDRKDPALFRPIVAIGHTKDLVDCDAVDFFLSYLHKNQVQISTFGDICRKIQPPIQMRGNRE